MKSFLEFARRAAAQMGGWRRAGYGRRGSCVRGCAALFAEEGQALAEMALMLPIFMLLLTGVSSLAIGIYNWQQLTIATTSAAQQVGSMRNLTADPCAAVKTTVTGDLPTWTASNFSYSLTITDGSGTANKYTSTSGNFTCTAGATQMSLNQPISLRVQYTYTWFPVFSMSLSSPIASSLTVSTQ